MMFLLSLQFKKITQILLLSQIFIILHRSPFSMFFEAWYDALQSMYNELLSPDQVIKNTKNTNHNTGRLPLIFWFYL